MLPSEFLKFYLNYEGCKQKTASDVIKMIAKFYLNYEGCKHNYYTLGNTQSHQFYLNYEGCKLHCGYLPCQ